MTPPISSEFSSIYAEAYEKPTCADYHAPTGELADGKRARGSMGSLDNSLSRRRSRKRRCARGTLGNKGDILGRFASLDHVDLGGTNVGDPAIAHLARHRDLKAVSLDSTALTTRGLDAITALPALHNVNLGNTQVNGFAWRGPVATCQVDVLLLHNTPTDDEGLAGISQLHKLNTLRIDGTKVSSAGLAHLAALKALRSLNIENTTIDLAGLESLKKLPKLEEVRWKGSRISDRDAKVFHLYLPANERRLREYRLKYERGELPL